MRHPWKMSWRGAVTLLGLAVASSAVAADSWLAVSSAGVQLADTSAVQAPAFEIHQSDLNGLVVSSHLHGLQVASRANDAGKFVELSWPGAKPSGAVGTPALPVIRELFVAPAGATISVQSDLGTAVLVDQQTLGQPVLVWPVQPPVEKTPGARENAPFVLDRAGYATDAALPAEPVSVKELGVVRGQRLCMLEIRPVAYNAVQQTLTLYPDVAVEIGFDGGYLPQDAMNPLPGFRRVVLNPEIVPQGMQRGQGNYLIVVPDTFAMSITPFANAKAAQGYTVLTHQVADGTSNSAIKSYISSLWGTPDAPDYVLLVGDTQFIPHWVGQGTGSPDTDLQYGCMDGSSDWYPDIAVGRFPVDNLNELNALVAKTLYVENGPLADPDYLKRAVFMASVDNYQISEGTHNYVINTHLEPNEYLCDKLYQVTYGADTQDVRDSFNDGRFYGVYSGHGGTYSWADGPPFSQNDVQNLTNENMYAYICSFACVTGAFAVDECFMETWVLVPDKGAAVAWGSSVNSYWDEDDILERVLFDAIFDEELDRPKEAAPMFDEGKMRLLDHYGPSGMIRRYFEMYNVMGDPALPLPGSCSDAGVLTLDSPKYACEATATVSLNDCGLNLDDNMVETVVVEIDSDSEAGETVLLTETNAGSALFEGSIMLSGTDDVGVLLVAEGDTVTVTYVDADNGNGEQVTVTADAIVDCTGPTISNVSVIELEARDAVVGFDADEMARGVVHYGLSCQNLNEQAGGGFAMSPTVAISGLDDNTTYYFMVEAYDEAGNMTADPECYTFTTPEVPDFFTEEFTSNDLAYLMLTFRVVGGNDHYDACVEEIAALPTDPAGGTTLSLSDDDSEQVSVMGGQVALYGVSYSSFFVGSNGYITFGSGDTDYTESLEDHFDMPRISALFDDLNPNSGGTISYKQLADRVAVTWEDLPEYYSEGSNTFQVELYFDGTIVIAYEALGSADNIVGLSEGEGVSPDYLEMDLSALGDCTLPGDMNCDGVVDFDDIDPFVLALGGEAGYYAAYPTCNWLNGDCDGNGTVDFDDINPFVALIGN